MKTSNKTLSRNNQQGRFAGTHAGKAVRDKLMTLLDSKVMSFGDMGKRRKTRKQHKMADKHNGGW